MLLRSGVFKKKLRQRLLNLQGHATAAPRGLGDFFGVTSTPQLAAHGMGLSVVHFIREHDLVIVILGGHLSLPLANAPQLLLEFDLLLCA